MYGRGWGEEVDFWDLFGVYLGVIGEFREESLRDLEEYSDQALDETRDRCVFFFCCCCFFVVVILLFCCFVVLL